MDDKLQNIFNQFNPTMSSDVDFMKRLNSNLDMVEFIKMGIAKKRKNYKMAIIIATLVGVLVGIILSALYPIFSSLILNSLILSNKTFQDQEVYANVILYCIIAICIIGSSLVTFDITQSLKFSNLLVKSKDKSAVN